jgi:pilus assembly protein CpaB
VVVAATDIPARTALTADMVVLRQVPVDNRIAGAYTDLGQVVNSTVTRFPIAANEQVLPSKVVSLTGAGAQVSDSLSFVIPQGLRGISITVSEVISAGGLVLPGDYIDIIGVFDVEFGRGSDAEKEDAYFAKIILQNVEVLAVAQSIVNTAPNIASSEEEAAAADGAATSGQRDRVTEAEPNPGAATVTLAVTQTQAQLLFLAEANGTLRLSVRPFGDDETPAVPFTVETELIPPNLPAPTVR